VGTSLKHFAANEQETGRMYVDSVVDERTLREVYLRPFEIAVRKAHPWTVMAAYNMLNGAYCTENAYLLQKILKREWGYTGIVMSDWLAVNDRGAGIEAGCHLQMPGAPTADRIVEAVQNGELEEGRLDEIVRELLVFILKAHAARKPNTTYDREAHHLLAQRAASEGITLLKNDGGLLPLEGEKLTEIAVIGAFAKSPRFQGGGSSEVVPTRVENAYDELVGLPGTAARFTYAPGYGAGDAPNPALLQEAQAAARRARVAVLFVGLPASHETEGVDRQTMALPESHNALIEAVLEAQPQVVVVLTNGSAVAMPWAGRVPAILEGWLGGQAGGGAIARILLGHVNPSGKLSETFPWRLEDTPPYPAFPALERECRYTEGLFTGYRWYDTRKIEPLFPFGHGLSYTTFAYRDLSLSTQTLGEGEELTISLRVRNSGERAGQEVVQLYIHGHHPRLPRPKRELRAFRKVALQPGEEEEISFRLSHRDFAFYDPDAGAWTVDTGLFDILVGATSRDIRLQESVTLEAAPATRLFTRLTPLRAWMANPATRGLVRPALQSLARSMGAGIDGDAKDEAFVNDFLLDLPVAKLAVMGHLSEQDLRQLIERANLAESVP
jgi:beta-glucosidase